MNISSEDIDSNIPSKSTSESGNHDDTTLKEFARNPEREAGVNQSRPDGICLNPSSIQARALKRSRLFKGGMGNQKKQKKTSELPVSE